MSRVCWCNILSCIFFSLLCVLVLQLLFRCIVDFLVCLLCDEDKRPPKYYLRPNKLVLDLSRYMGVFHLKSLSV